MTREEIENNRQYQLTGAAIDYCRENHPYYEGDTLGEITDAFEAGAEWADRTMIDKAVRWLTKYASDYAFSIYDEDDACSFDIFSDLLIEDFRKAMKE